jgi:hypothetical protein
MTNLKTIGRGLAAVALAAFLPFMGMGCGSEDAKEPRILNTSVEPATWSINGLVDNPTFTVTTDIVDLDNDVKSAKATVTGTNISVDLAKKDDIGRGERWEGATQVTLIAGLSKGTYDVAVTATDAEGHSITNNKAATVTITD